MPNKLLLAILLLVYSSVIYYYVQDSCMQKEWCGQDMDQYMDYSNSLLSGNGYSAQKVSNLYFLPPKEGQYIPETMRLPAFSLLLTAGRTIYSESTLLVIYNIAFIFLIHAYSYKLFLLFFKKDALFPLLLILLSPSLLFYTTRMGNVDLFSYAMVTGFVYYAVLLYKKEMSRKIIFLTFFFGVGAIFSRQNTLLFILPVLLFPLLPLIKKRKLDRYSRVFLGLVVSFVILLVVWVGRNYTITKSLAISTASESQLLNEYTYFSLFPNAETNKLVAWIHIDKAGEKYMQDQLKKNVPVGVAYVTFNKEIAKRTREYMLTHPKLVLNQFRISIASLFLDPTFQWNKNDVMGFLKLLEKPLNTIILLGFIISPALCIKQFRRESIFIPLWIGSITYVLFSAFYHGTVIGNRGILPLYTIIILLAFNVTISIRDIYLSKGNK